MRAVALYLDLVVASILLAAHVLVVCVGVELGSAAKHVSFVLDVRLRHHPVALLPDALLVVVVRGEHAVCSVDSNIGPHGLDLVVFAFDDLARGSPLPQLFLL